MSDTKVSRRHFLASLPGLALAASALGLRPSGLGAVGLSLREHPDPRPGIDGSKVLGADDLQSYKDLIPLFDGIRKHAALADGITCYCGCALLEGYRSLLTCFEEGFDMGKYCPICQGQGRLLVGRAEEGQTLEQIRRAIDARYGGGAETPLLASQRRHGVHSRRAPRGHPGGE